jgi:hypothetical protein
VVTLLNNFDRFLPLRSPPCRGSRPRGPRESASPCAPSEDRGQACRISGFNVTIFWQILAKYFGDFDSKRFFRQLLQILWRFWLKVCTYCYLCQIAVFNVMIFCQILANILKIYTSFAENWLKSRKLCSCYNIDLGTWARFLKHNSVPELTKARSSSFV